MKDIKILILYAIGFSLVILGGTLFAMSSSDDCSSVSQERKNYCQTLHPTRNYLPIIVFIGGIFIVYATFFTKRDEIKSDRTYQKALKNKIIGVRNNETIHNIYDTDLHRMSWNIFIKL